MIKFQNVTKMYGNNIAVDNMNLTIHDGEFVCFIGTSGSGKTTSMRMINRMVNPTSGKIFIDKKDIRAINEVNLRRSIGYVIQQVGLMPHMNIYENIVMVPKLLKWDKERMKNTAHDLVRRVDLNPSILEQYPSELSGGMQQRIGVIRALAADQEIILMDEPFGALDPITRDSLQRLVKKLQKEMHRTIVFVTHDMDEALNLADRIVVMSEGKIVQVGTPMEILRNPANDFVKEMVGEDRLNQAAFEYETVTKVMRDAVKINQNETVAQAARLMATTRVDDILVVDDENILVGRIDMRTLNRRQDRDLLVKDIMKQVTYIKDSMVIRDAIYYIQELGHRNISVVNDAGRLLGLVTRGDIVSSVYEAFWADYEPENLSHNETFESGDKVSDATLQGQNGSDVDA